MTFTVSVESELAYLVVTATGAAGLPQLSGFAALTGEVASRGGFTRALLNFLAVRPDLSFTEHLRFGAQASDSLGRLDKVAAVVSPGFLDAPSAKAAQRSGLQLRTFLDLTEAIVWLEQTTAK